MAITTTTLLIMPAQRATNQLSFGNTLGRRTHHKERRPRGSPSQSIFIFAKLLLRILEMCFSCDCEGSAPTHTPTHPHPPTHTPNYHHHVHFFFLLPVERERD
ncbi:hypothetical protein EYF80_017261 [Liparis tanakae]|uniref:Uncharacterized protein n=1 Tax=Liparis tanakae TaxID=230148 RepID=A0A4Z2I4W3_9TELE|nr:hypothetical protein EYF80_017261 [Liparis tanakae]